jgi:toxin HigB-1
VRIRSIRHKGLRHFVEHDDASKLPVGSVEKLRVMISFLQDMKSESEVRNVPMWKAHRLTGDMKNHWSLFVTRNWRLTFRVDRKEIEIVDLDFVDYH